MTNPDPSSKQGADAPSSSEDAGRGNSGEGMDPPGGVYQADEGDAGGAKDRGRPQESPQRDASR